MWRDYNIKIGFPGGDRGDALPSWCPSGKIFVFLLHENHNGKLSLPVLRHPQSKLRVTHCGEGEVPLSLSRTIPVSPLRFQIATITIDNCDDAAFETTKELNKSLFYYDVHNYYNKYNTESTDVSYCLLHIIPENGLYIFFKVKKLSCKINLFPQSWHLH